MQESEMVTFYFMLQYDLQHVPLRYIWAKVKENMTSCFSNASAPETQKNI